jgi:hypothetical protein
MEEQKPKKKESWFKRCKIKLLCCCNSECKIEKNEKIVDNTSIKNLKNKMYNNIIK